MFVTKIIVLTYISLVQGDVYKNFRGDLEGDVLAENSLYSSPCIVSLVQKYLNTNERFGGSTVVLSIMLKSAFGQRYYLEALNDYDGLTYMLKRPERYHYATEKMIEKAQMYLIFLADAEEITIHLKLLTSLLTYNTYAKIIACFLVEMTREEFLKQQKKAFQILFDNDFFDIFVFGMVPGTSILQSYTMFPYDNGNCAKKVNKIELVDECEFLTENFDEMPQSLDEIVELSKNESNMRFIEYKKFYPKIPEHMNGCVIRVTASPFEPYVTLKKYTSAIDKGLEVEMLNATFHEMGANVKFLFQDPRLRYLRRTMDNKTSVYKAIMNKESPFLIGGFMRTPVMNRTVQVSDPYAYDDVTWCVHEADLAPEWLNTFKTYSWELWLAIGVSICCSGVLLFMFIRFEQENQHQNLAWSCLSIVGTLVSMFTVKYFPRKIFIRVFMTTLLFAGINLWAAYTSSLISILTKPRFDKQISTIPEAVDADYIFYGNINYLDFIKENKINEPGYKEVVKRFEVCDSLEQCFNSFILNKKSAIATSRIQGLHNPQSLSVKKYCFDISQNLYEYSVTTTTYPYHHLLPILNDMIGRVLQSGLLIKWASDVKVQTQNDVSQGEIKLSLENLQGVFVLLGIGTLLAVVAFVVEWVYFIHKNGTVFALEKLRMIAQDIVEQYH